MSQQGDVLLFQTNDDGDVNIVNGVIDMTGGFETAAYMSLFGGNEDDDNRKDSSKAWWGNFNQVDPARREVSETQNLLRALPISSANLQRIEEAVNRDLQWFLDNNIASSIDVTVTLPALNTIGIEITIQANGEESTFKFTENWRAMADAL